MTPVLVAILGILVVPIINLAAIIGASVGVARAFGVTGGRLPFELPPRERLEASSRWAFGATVAAAPVASYLCAAGLALASLLASSRPVYDGTIDVSPNGRAAAAGMRSGDRIVAIDGKPIARFEQIGPALAGRAETHLAFVVEREGEGERLTFDVVTDQNVKVQVRASGTPRNESVPVGEALTYAVTGPARVLVTTVSNFVTFVIMGDQPQLGGPVGVVQATSRAAPVSAASFVGVLGMYNSYYWPLSWVVAYLMRPRRRASPPDPQKSPIVAP